MDLAARKTDNSEFYLSAILFICRIRVWRGAQKATRGVKGFANTKKTYPSQCEMRDRASVCCVSASEKWLKKGAPRQRKRVSSTTKLFIELANCCCSVHSSSSGWRGAKHTDTVSGAVATLVVCVPCIYVADCCSNEAFPPTDCGEMSIGFVIESTQIKPPSSYLYWRCGCGLCVLGFMN